MKAKMHQELVGDNQLSGNEQVRMEIQTYLHALDSYPERFARNPSLTFEKYCSSLIPPGKSEGRN